MQENQLNKYIKLAMEADRDGDYKSADKIDNLIKEAQNPFQTGWRRFVDRIRGVGDESARARRQVRDLSRGPNVIDRMRTVPDYDEVLELLDDEKNVSGHNPMVGRSNSRLIDRIINALQPAYRQVQSKQKEFPQLYARWKTLYDTRIEEIKRMHHLADDEIDDWLEAHPREREQLVSPLENELVQMRDAHVALIETAIDHVCSTYGIPRNMENANQIKASIASERQLRGMLYDNSFTTDNMIEQVLQHSTIPMRSYLYSMGPWKRTMSPAVTALLFSGASAAGTAALMKGKQKPDAPKATGTDGSNVGRLTNEIDADRKKAKLFDTPIETMEKYLTRKKNNGSIKPGITKKELYNMALIDLGEHIANNLIQYVMKTYGFTIPRDSSEEEDFEVKLF